MLGLIPLGFKRTWILGQSPTPYLRILPQLALVHPLVLTLTGHHATMNGPSFFVLKMSQRLKVSGGFYPHVSQY
jgi:hypothetical protein